MKIRSLIGATLLLAATGLGTALAAPGFDFPARPDHAARTADLSAERGERPYLQVSERSRRDDDDDGDRKHGHRKHHDDDDDDDDDGDRRASRPRAPMNPNAPVPDNGLFAGKARPQVQVQ